MSLRINHNIASINGHRNMLRNDKAVSASLEKLSSGLRINRAADDAAGLVISEQMRAQITGIEQAIDNSETAISMVQVSEGALDEVNSLLVKARSLILHAANEGANDINQLLADQAELDNVIEAITRISDNTQFGTKKLLDGSLNGSTDLTPGLERVRVGNLANNPGIAAGTMSIAVAPSDFESNTLIGATSPDTNGTIFTPAGITGMESLSGSTQVSSGVVVSLQVDGRTLIVPVGSGGMSVDTVVSELNTRISGALLDYEASVDPAGGITISRTVLGADDFSAVLSFSRASGADTQGNGAASTASIGPGGGTVAQSANAYFGTADFSTLSTGSSFADPTTVIRYTVTTATGTFTASGTASGFAVAGGGAGTAFGDVLNGILVGVSGVSSALAAATFDLQSSTNGFSLTLDSNNETLSGIDFAIEFDYPNTLGGTDTIVALDFASFANATSSGLFGGTAPAAVTGATTVSVNANVALTINGQSIQYLIASGTTINDIGSGLQNAIDARFGAGVYEIAFFGTGDTLTGTNFADATVANPATNSFLLRTVQQNGDDIQATISWDSNVVSGLDAVDTGAVLATGVTSSAVFDLDTLSQAAITGLATVSGHAALTMTNLSGSTVNVAGSSGLTATLTTTSGLILQFASDHATPRGGLFELTADPANLGFTNVTFEVDSGVVGQAVTTNLLFTLNDGAVFQVGPNADQLAGFVVDDMGADELGRNAQGAGPLDSLEDLGSTREQALLNGLTSEALHVLDKAIDDVTNTRGLLGAFQSNSLESNLSSLRISMENLVNAESTIRDVDFAAESAEFTKNNILIQSATSMLAQANQLPQNVLQLLQ